MSGGVMAGRYGKVSEPEKVVSMPGVSDREMSDEEAKQISDSLKPKNLTDDQSVVWDRNIPELAKANRVKPLYIEFLKGYVCVVARMDYLLTYLEENQWSYTTEGRNGEQHKPRPEVAQYNDDWRKWNSFINQLGISPATDQRFHDAQPDLFDTFGD